MLLTRLETSAAMAVWRSVETVLQRALARDPDGPDALRMAVEGNDTAIWIAHGFSGIGALGIRLADVSADDRTPALWVTHAAGHFQAGQGAGLMREVMALLESAAKRLGLCEVRFGGRRGWSRVFPDYEILSRLGGDVQFRKVLSHA